MKLNYRERVILLVVLVVVIFGVGIFAFIKPQWEKLKTNEKKLADAKTAWSTKLAEFDSINEKRDTIVERRNSAYDLSQEFTDEMDAIHLDKFLQEKFINTDKHKEDNVKLVGNLSVSDESSTSIAYYYYTPKILTYPLYENADFDNSLKAATAEKLLESGILSALNAQTVGNSTAQFTLKVNREDTMALIDAVHDYAIQNKDAMILNSVSIADYDFNEYMDEADAKLTDETGKALTGSQLAAAVVPEYTTVTFSYTVYYMQEPTEVKSLIGPEYNASVWDGKEWKTMTVSEPA